MAEFATSIISLAQVTIFNWFNNGWSELVFWSEYWSYNGTSTKHATCEVLFVYLCKVISKIGTIIKVDADRKFGKKPKEPLEIGFFAVTAIHIPFC